MNYSIEFDGQNIHKNLNFITIFVNFENALLVALCNGFQMAHLSIFLPKISYNLNPLRNLGDY